MKYQEHRRALMFFKPLAAVAPTFDLEAENGGIARFTLCTLPAPFSASGAKDTSLSSLVRSQPNTSASDRERGLAILAIEKQSRSANPKRKRKDDFVLSWCEQ